MSERLIHCAQALLPQGWRSDVCLEVDAEGVILAAATDVTPGPGQRLAGVVVPGMPNVHSHGFQHLMAGLTGGAGGTADSFWGWRTRMYELATRITPDQFEDCLAWVYLRLLRAGYTSCAEFHYLHHQPDGTPYARREEMSSRALAAARAARMPITLLPVLYCRAGFDTDTVEPHQRRYRNDIDAYLALLDDCRSPLAGSPHCVLGVAPHSLRAVDPGSLERLLAGMPRDLPRHLHIAEQPREVEECLAHLGARPVQWLLDHAAVDGSWCLVHATHMNGEEVRRAAATGAVAGLCPTTEADLGDGFFETDRWLRSGGRFGVGSDSNVRMSVVEELRQLEYAERLRQQRRNVLAGDGKSCGRLLYEQAADGGARALGQPVGRLAPGRRADLVELDAGHPLLEGREGDALLDSWIFAGGEDMIRSVWVAGERVIDAGSHPGQDRLEARFRRAMAALL